MNCYQRGSLTSPKPPRYNPAMQQNRTTGQTTAPDSSGGPRASVVVPAYNAAGVLPACLAALQAQTYPAAFRRAAFLAAGGFDERFPTANNEDVELSYRLAAQGARLVFAPTARVYHTHPATLGRYLRVKFGRGYWRTLVYRMYPGKAL